MCRVVNLLAACAFFLTGVPAYADLTVEELPLSAARVGTIPRIAANSEGVDYRLITVSLLMPNNSSPARTSCLRRAFAASLQEMRSGIQLAYAVPEITQKAIEELGPDANPADLENVVQARQGDSLDLIVQAIVSPLSSNQCGVIASSPNEKDYHLGLAVRHCRVLSDALRSPCGIRGFQPATIAGDQRATNLLVDYLTAAKALSPNTVLKIMDSAAPVPLPPNAIVSRYRWPLDSEAIALEHYEYEIRRLRKSTGGPKISYAVPRLLSLHNNVVLHTLDVYTDSAWALVALQTGGTQALSLVDDEFARSRIIECSQFQPRGELGQASIAAAVGVCAGYTVDPKSLIDCVQGGRCMPAFREQARAVAVQVEQRIVDVHELAMLAERPKFPRVYDPNATIDQYIQSAMTCGDGKATDNPRTAKCRALHALGKAGDIQGAIDRCVKPGVAQTHDQIASCLRGIAPHDTGALQCFAAARPENVAGCVLREQGGNVAALVTCFGGLNSSTKATEKLSGCLPSQFRAADVQECMSGDDVVKSIICISDKTHKLTIPKEVLVSYQCAKDPQTTMKSFALCAGPKIVGVPGIVSEFTDCYVRGSGNAGSVGVCMTATHMHLTAAQQIIIACAVESGGSAHVFAVCTAGQFGVSTLVGCRGKKFGDEGCFGRNNELMRFCRNVLRFDPSKNYAIKNYADLELKLLDAEYKVANKIAKHGETAYVNYVSFAITGPLVLTGAGKTVRRELRKVVHAVGL